MQVIRQWRAGEQTVGLPRSDADRIESAISNAASESTRANYRSQWRLFEAWCSGRGGRDVQPLPASPDLVAAYLVERSEKIKVATLGVARSKGRAQRQARPLDSDALAAIAATARNPRPGRRGSLETRGYAELRGWVDIAICRTMFDGLLRLAEAAALRWADISPESDGAGRMLITRSKTDPEGAGDVLYLSPKTMTALDAIRPADCQDDDSVFGLSAAQIARRIGQAARAAGLGDGFSGHSTRVGMAQELARANIELPAIMQAGRWQSPYHAGLLTCGRLRGLSSELQFLSHSL